MTPKIISYDVEIKSTSKLWVQKVPEVYTNDSNSVEIQFNLIDCTEAELLNSTAQVLLYMRDRSFFQNTGVDVVRTGTTFSYTLKDNEGNHQGLTETQLVLTIPGTPDDVYASQMYQFKIKNGLGNNVPVETFIQTWETLTVEANAFIAQMETDVQEFDVALESGVLATNIAAKLNNLETTYAPRLLSAEQQLEQVAKVFVTPDRFGAIGDGVTDDTLAIQAAIDYCYGVGGGTVTCSGLYLINSITVKSKVKVMFTAFKYPYISLNQTDLSAFDIGFKRPSNSTGNGVTVLSGGYIENVMVLGGNQSVENYGIYLNVGAESKNIYVAKGFHGIYNDDCDMDGFYAFGNIGNGVMYKGADLWATKFMVTSNGGHGFVFAGLSTTTFSNGKVEWNKKHNIYSTAYAMEIVFDHCIIDASNWFNIYCENSAKAFRFNNCAFIGGRYDDELYPLPTESTIFAMIYLKKPDSSMIFSGCFFRKNNISGQTTSHDNLVSILAIDSAMETNTGQLIFVGCLNPELKLCSYGTKGSIYADNITSNGIWNDGQKYKVTNLGNSIRAYPLSTALIQGAPVDDMPLGTTFYDYTLGKLVTKSSDTVNAWKDGNGKNPYLGLTNTPTMDMLSSVSIQALSASLPNGTMVFDVNLQKTMVKTSGGWRTPDGVVAY